MNPYVLDSIDPRIAIPLSAVLFIVYFVIVKVQNRKENHRG